MNKIEIMQARLKEKLLPVYLNIHDDSSKHAGHAGARPEGETHFRIDVISEKFTGLSRIARHRMVNDLLGDLFKQGLHALEIHAKSPHEKQGAE